MAKLSYRIAQQWHNLRSVWFRVQGFRAYLRLQAWAQYGSLILGPTVTLLGFSCWLGRAYRAGRKVRLLEQPKFLALEEITVVT